MFMKNHEIRKTRKIQINFIFWVGNDLKIMKISILQQRGKIISLCHVLISLALTL